MADEAVRVFDWEDEIEKEGGEFIVLPEGDYDFVVDDFERARFEGSEKMPACPKAILHLSIDGGELGTVKKSYHLFLNSKMEFRLCQFFTAIGLREKGEKLKMDWTEVKGAGGRLHLVKTTYTNKQGAEVPSNDIDRFIEPEEPKFTAGQF